MLAWRRGRCPSDALGAWLAAHDRQDEAAELVAAARGTYAELGATAWIAELDGASEASRTLDDATRRVG